MNNPNETLWVIYKNMKLEEREGEGRTVALGRKKGITENGRGISHVVGCEISL